MNEFFYIISFLKEDELLQLNINLAYEDYLVPVFNRSFYDNKMEIKQIYEQIFEYFNHTNIKVTKNDFNLFYNAFKDFDIKLPNPNEITILDKDLHPSSGLSPKEILFLMYIDRKGIHAKKAKYWTSEYHLDIDYTIDKLIQLDYITTDDYLFNLSKATKKELCAPLDQNNISYTGNKPDILKIVVDSFTETELKKYYIRLYYKQTIKGEEISTSNQYLNDFHKSYYRYANQLKIEEFYILNKRFKDLDAKDVCKMMVDKKSGETISDFDWDKFFEEEVKNENEIKNFADVIQKYSIATKAELQDVSQKDFLDVVYNEKNVSKQEEKEVYLDSTIESDLNEAEEAFFNVVYKGKKESPKKDKIENKKNEAVEAFFNVANKKRKESPIKEKINDEIDGVEEAFFKVINKKRKESPIKEKIDNEIDADGIEEAFFKVINKKRKELPKKEKIVNEIDVDETFLKALNKVKVNEEEIKIVEQEKVEYEKENDLNTVKSSLFIRSFLYSSGISLVIIYTLYQFVFK